MKPVVIIGTGGHGREALDIIDAMNADKPRYEMVGFIDDAREKGSFALPHEIPVLGGVDHLRTMNVGYVPAIGLPAIRRRIVESLPDHEAVDLIHPSATIGSHVDHGPGLIMAAGARITHAIRLGKHVHMNLNATVSHDCTVGDFVTITPGVSISGGVTIGDEVWMGIGSSVIQQVTIGDRSVVGAGAAIIRDVAASVVVVGVPSRPLPNRQGEAMNA